MKISSTKLSTILRSTILLLLIMSIINTIYAQKIELPIKDTISTKTFLDRKQKSINSIAVKDGLYEAVYFYDNKVYKSVFPVTKNRYISIYDYSYWRSISIISIPFKVRPALEGLPQNANTSLKSVGLTFGPYIKWDRYFAHGKVSTHKLSLSFLFAPASEEFNPDNSNGKIAKSNQLVLSTGLGATYTYNSLSFALFPYAKDYGVSKDKNDWIYNKKYWFGFGIGIDTKLFGF